MSCQLCGKETNNPKFCSRSCSAKMNNKVPKRKRIGGEGRYQCKGCGGEIIRYDRKYCGKPECDTFHRDWSKITVQEIYDEAKYQKGAYIRQLARQVYKKLRKPRECLVCGYDLHFDICHITSISEFPKNTPIAIVNAENNLIALCKNHHWEFDHGILDISTYLV